jgi:hypothetical protein
MEWRLSREKEVARKIFEKGLDSTASGCLTQPKYILAYVAFLCGEACPGVTALSPTS